jgi:hypothetical protein
MLVACAAAGVALAQPDLSISSQQRKRAKSTDTKKQAPPAAKKAAPSRDTLPPREAFTAAEQAAAVIPGIADARFWADSVADFERTIPQMPGPWLALSSGGADGAFGAGVIVGMSTANARPEFSLVTGVSTGALMAPFVFLGPRYDAALREVYTSITAADIFELGGKGESFFDTWPLKSLIAKRVTSKLLEEIAAEHRKGRRLFVLTTNLDAERPVVWNMGAIAEKGGEQALKLFRDVLLASSSIPGAFPPVLIEVEANEKTFREMHADGGLNNQFYVAPAALLATGSDYRIPATELFLIINTGLAPSFAVTERETVSILGRAVSVGVRTLTRFMIDAAYAAAKRSGVPFHLATIDSKFSPPSRGAFDPDYMKALFAFGSEQARNGVAFRAEP